MNIIQQPDALSLSMNLKKFVLNSDAQVSFVLKKSEVEILSQRYDPDRNGRIEIDVRDIVHAQLAYILKEETLPYEQTGLAALFKATIDEQEVSFTAVRGGVDRLADTATNFLTQNWLTWQPTVKPVTYYSPEFLTYYAVKAGVVKLKATLPDESNQSVDLAQLEAGKAYTIPVQYSTVVGKLGDKKPAYYDVWVEDAEGQRLTYIQRYYADAMRSISEDWVLFENSLGGLDCFRAYGATNLEAEHTHNLAEIDEVSEEYRVDTERKYQKNTGHLGKDEARWLLDFFPSQRKYIYTGSYLRQIVVVESDVTGNLRELPASYTFTYKYADARPLLNLPRTDVPADMLDITIPEVGNFTIPPRLAEVPRLPLSEGDLFPVQNPYSENWGTTTLGAIAEIIGQLLSTIAGSGGGVGHTHNNIELLNALSYIQEYLLVNGKKIKAGYADLAGDVEGDKLLRKDRPEETEYLLKLLGGVLIKGMALFGEYITGVSGGFINEKGEAELERLFLRSELIVSAIRYNYMTYFMGYILITPGGGLKVKDFVDNGDGTWTVTPDLEEGMPCGQYVDDILLGYWYDKNEQTGDFAGFRKVQFRVVSVDYDEKTFVMAPRPDTNSVPYKEMKLGQTGNFTNENRQTYMIFDVRDGNNCITFFDHANTWDPEPAQTPSWFGKKKGMTVGGINCDNYSAVLQNILLTGLIFQIDEITGDAVRVPVDKGSWSTGKYAYYDRVSHNGALWLCVATEGTEEEPGTGNAWLKQVSEGQKGDPGLSVVGGGHWESSETPYEANTLVSFYNCVFISNVKTSNPPIAIARFKDGSYIRQKNGGYILAGRSADFTVHPDWTMLLDGRELKGTSITFLGSFATAPSNPVEGNSYYNTTDKCTYIYQNGQWMLMVSDGKDGRDYEYIYTRNNSIGLAPDKPDNKQQDDYVPEGWTDDYLGVNETFQVEWGCKRTKRDGIWSEWSDPAIVHRWSKDGENAVIADLDNEMVNCAMTSDGKTSKAQSWVTNVSIWYGYESLPLESISTTQPSGITVSANKDTGAVTVSVAQNVVLSETNDVVITLTATKNGQNFERKLTFTIAGVRSGENGQDAVLYSLLPSASSIVKYKDGSYNISTISCKRQKTVGGTISDTTDGTLKYSLDGGSETSISDNTGIATSSIKKSVKFLFYVNEKLVDVETIPVVTDGSDGKGIASSDVMFYLSNSSTSLSGGSWVTNAPAWVDGKYYWSKTVITYTDGTQTETTPVCISGGKGPSGNGISKVEELYYQSDSRTSLTGGSWSTTSPAWKEGKYIWTRTAIYFTNGEVSYTSAICAAGQDGTSVTAVGHWVSSKVPYYKNNLVNFGRGTFVALKDTSNPPLPIARFKDGTYMRMKDGGYILSGKFADMQVNADWQMMSWGEESETLYWLDCPISAFSLTSTGSASPSSVEVTCKQSKSGNVSSCADLWLAARRYNGSWIAHVNAIKAPSIGVSAVSGYTQYSVRAYRNQSDANAWNENYVTEKGIAVSEQGIQGINGAFPYDRGVYKSGNSYVWNQNRRDKVICLIDGVYYNFLVKNYGATVTAKPSSAGGDSNWEAMQKYDSIVTDTFFADGANIGGFMFKLLGYINNETPYGELRSQNVDDNGTPVLYMNSQTGYFHSILGEIGSFSIDGNGLKNLSDNPTAYIQIEKNGGKFFRVNMSDTIMCSIRADSAMALSLSTYGSSSDSIGLSVMCNAQGNGYAIRSYGAVLLSARDGECVNVNGLGMNITEIMSNYTVKTNDDIILCSNTSVITVTLPNMMADTRGKIIILKTMGSSVNISGTIIRSGTSVSSYNTYSLPAKSQRIFVSFDASWIELSC